MDLPSLLRLIAPEFASTDEETVQQWIDLTKTLVSDTAFGAVYEQAVVYLTAHRMKMAGLGETGMFGNMAERAGVASYTEGSTSVSFGTTAASVGAEDSSLALTPYGLEYLRLRKTIIPIMVRRD